MYRRWSRAISAGVRRSSPVLKKCIPLTNLQLSLARKTKCDGQHPTCQSCSRRNLPCSYVNESSGRGKRGHAAAQAAAAQAAAVESQKQKQGTKGGKANANGNAPPPEIEDDGDDADADSGSETVATGRGRASRGYGGKRGIEDELDEETSSTASKRMRVASRPVDEKPRGVAVA